MSEVTELKAKNLPTENPTDLNDRSVDSVRSMFSSIAPTYNLVNSVLSFGIHHRWRKTAVKQSEAPSDAKVLDCATGTGDLAMAFKNHLGPNSHVIATDFCQEMMDNAPEKALQMGIQFEQADCKNLRFSDHEFDLVSISFGIRNVIPPEEGIREMWRVLKPGGELFIIEFGRAKSWWMQIVYNFYSTKVIPFVGGLLSKNKQAYSYLDKSSRQFPCGRDFIKLLRNSAKFKSVEATPLSNGIAYIYRAVKK